MSLTTPFSDAAKNNVVPNIFMDLSSSGFEFETLSVNNDEQTRNVFRITKHPEHIPLTDINGRMDLAFIADAYSRHATFHQPEQVKALMDAVQKLGAALTWVEGTGNGLNPNGVIENATSALKVIRETAIEIGAKEISLPFAPECTLYPNSTFGKAISAELSASNVQISCREAPYNADLSALGSLDENLKASGLFNGSSLRGFLSYDDIFRYFWENDLRDGMGKDGQTSFNFVKEHRPLEFYLN